MADKTVTVGETTYTVYTLTIGEGEDADTVTLYENGGTFYEINEEGEYVITAADTTAAETVKTFALGVDTKAEFIALVDEIAAPFASVLDILLGDDGSIGYSAAVDAKDGLGIGVQSPC